MYRISILIIIFSQIFFASSVYAAGIAIGHPADSLNHQNESTPELVPSENGAGLFEPADTAASQYPDELFEYNQVYLLTGWHDYRGFLGDNDYDDKILFGNVEYFDEPVWGYGIGISNKIIFGSGLHEYFGEDFKEILHFGCTFRGNLLMTADKLRAKGPDLSYYESFWTANAEFGFLVTLFNTLTIGNTWGLDYISANCRIEERILDNKIELPALITGNGHITKFGVGGFLSSVTYFLQVEAFRFDMLGEERRLIITGAQHYTHWLVNTGSWTIDGSDIKVSGISAKLDRIIRYSLSLGLTL